jgi:hypothetical protein
MVNCKGCLYKRSTSEAPPYTIKEYEDFFPFKKYPMDFCYCVPLQSIEQINDEKQCLLKRAE